VCALAGAVACAPTDPIPPAEERLLVEAVLRADRAEQVVLIRKVGGSLGINDDPVTGAAVSIIGPDGTEIPASEAGPGFYFVDYSVLGRTIVPGGTYALRVLTRSGIEVTGTTTVPNGEAISNVDVEPIASFSRANDTLRAALPRVPGAKSYYVGVRATLSYAPGYAELRYSAFTDTAITLHGTIELFDGDPVFTPFDTVTVVAGAVDDNFYTYYHANVDPFAGAPPSRLQGALGVFGAFVPLYRRRFAVVE
jgi:hypothetical protein